MSQVLPGVRLDPSVELQHLRLQRLTDGAQGGTPAFAGLKLRPEDDIRGQLTGRWAEAQVGLRWAHLLRLLLSSSSCFSSTSRCSFCTSSSSASAAL